MPNNNDNNWGRYSKLVLQKLKDHEDLLKDISKVLTEIRVEIAMLKVKSGVWGLLAGAVPVIVLLVVQYLKT